MAAARGYAHLLRAIAPDRATVRSQITSAQAMLAAHGYTPGAPGEHDHATRTAVSQFQAATGLPVTGGFDARTVAALQQPPTTAGRPRRSGGSAFPNVPSLPATGISHAGAPPTRGSIA